MGCTVIYPDADKINRLIQDQGFSAARLELKSGISRPTIRKIRKGLPVRKDTLEILAETLGVNPSEIGLKTEVPVSSGRNWLAAARIAHGYTQADLAHMIGFSRSSVANWEADITPPSGPAKTALNRLLDIDFDAMDRAHIRRIR